MLSHCCNRVKIIPLTVLLKLVTALLEYIDLTIRELKIMPNMPLNHFKMLEQFRILYPIIMLKIIQA